MNKLSSTNVIGVGLILSVYLTIGSLYAINTPEWQAPDEPAHYNYVKHISKTGKLPVLKVGDYDQGYISKLTERGFPSDMTIDLLRYEAHQPPLYYLLATPVFIVFDGSLLALRLFSLVLGGCVIVLSGMATNVIFPGNLPITLSVCGFIAFLPQHLAIMSSVNNDSLAAVWMILGLWLIVRRTTPWVIGIVVGLAFLTKATVYILAIVATVTAVQRVQKREVRLSYLWQLFAPALFMGTAWWLRNILVYGWPDFLGLINHSEVVVGQPRTLDWLDKFGEFDFSRRFIQTTFNSFWGQFGWMAVPMKLVVFRFLTILSLMIVIGNYLLLRLKFLKLNFEKINLLVVVFTLATVVLQYIWYNVEYVQHQGRYLFPALLPLALFCVLGICGWARCFENYWPKHKDIWYWLPVVLIPIMVILSVHALYYTIIPAFA